MPWSVELPDTTLTMDFRYYLALLMPWIVVLSGNTNAMDCGII